MKKRKYFYLCMSMVLLCITGCTTKANLETITPSTTIAIKENERIKMQGSIFKEQTEKNKQYTQYTYYQKNI